MISQLKFDGGVVCLSMTTKVSCGWIGKGRKTITKTAFRTRMNLFGLLNLEIMKVSIWGHSTIDISSIKIHFKKLREKYLNVKNPFNFRSGHYNKSSKTHERGKKNMGSKFIIFSFTLQI